jgi:acyl-CoA synthetase (AMP-forming)/AMP-acid ligase II
VFHSVCGRVPFVEGLRAHGERLAVVGPDGTTLSYRELADRVDAVRERLGPVRRLVMVAAGPEVEPLVTYLAALRGGHPVLLTAPDDPARLHALVAAYDPDVVLVPDGAGWVLRERRPGTAHDLHPELALLLSTSGSTGSPKLVRLSARGVQANAAAIAEYLDIRPTDRAAAMLPLHYCYGLSIVHSNLLRGAAVVLTARSVVEPAFWELARTHGLTSLHGVPHTFDLLDRAGLPDLPSLRYVTQAGGRLAPGAVRRYAELGAASGWRFFVMYGQTEATARMAYLPPELAAARPGAIGVPVPGGELSLAPDTGELLYRGPNVMLGYATGPADLARGRTVDVLATGDLARRAPDGLFELVGRRSRFVKPFGLRIDLDGVERLLAADGVAAACAGDDTGLVLAVAGADPAPVAAAVAGRLGLPAGSVVAVAVAELPRLPTGKLDHAAVAARRSDGVPGPARRPREASVRAVFARVLRCPEVPDDATFMSLGGDSLSYVEMSLALEDLLGDVPADWPTRTVAELERPARPRRFTAAVETAVVLRAVAIVLVVASHVGLVKILGGAHLLLALSGWSFARFALPAVAPAAPGVAARLARSALRIAVPTVLWLAWRAAVEDDVALHNVLLLNYLLDPAAWGYWFIESLLQILALLALLFAIPGVRRWERRQPFGFALLALGLGVLARGISDPGNEFSDRFMSPHLVLWIFVLGWLAHRAATPGQKAAVAALVLVLVPGFFADPVREAVLGVGLLLVLLVPRVVVPRPAARLLGVLAAASLYVYLTHYAVYPELLPYLATGPVVVLSLAVGVAAWFAAGWIAEAAVQAANAVRGPGRRGRGRSGPGKVDQAGGEHQPSSAAGAVASTP